MFPSDSLPQGFEKDSLVKADDTV